LVSGQNDLEDWFATEHLWRNLRVPVAIPTHPGEGSNAARATSLSQVPLRERSESPTTAGQRSTWKRPRRNILEQRETFADSFRAVSDFAANNS
jgi:hypothetical protein